MFKNDETKFHQRQFVTAPTSSTVWVQEINGDGFPQFSVNTC